MNNETMNKIIIKNKKIKKKIIIKKMIKFLLMVNKQRQTRLAHYTKYISIKERTKLEGELVRKCLSRNNK